MVKYMASGKILPVKHIIKYPTFYRLPINRPVTAVHTLVRRDADVREERQQIAHAIYMPHFVEHGPAHPTWFREHGGGCWWWRHCW